jgi:hypothetical protein
MKHLRENNETYLSHLVFANEIALHLYLVSFCLLLHAIFPFWKQPERFTLDSTCKKIQEWNDYSKRRRQ